MQRIEQLGLDPLATFGLPPADYVALAAGLGCGHVALAFGPLPWNPLGFPPWSLREDRAVRRALAEALAARALGVSVVVGFSLRAGAEISDMAPEMDLAAELGARRLATVGMDPDVPRAHDQLAILTEMAAARGLEVVLDYAPHQAINSLEGACAALRHTGSPAARLSLDAMHVFRAGGSAADVAALDPALIGYAQLCDAPRLAPHGDYARETLFERLVPGEGELPLADFVAALPSDTPIGVEVPNLAAAQACGLAAVVGRAVAASRALLEQTPRSRP